MQRDVYKALLDWRDSARRKPLIIQGARQVGKTTLIRTFGRDQYRAVAYLNFEEMQDVGALFSASLTPSEWVPKIATYRNLKLDNNFLNVPLYFVARLNDLLKQ